MPNLVRGSLQQTIQHWASRRSLTWSKELISEDCTLCWGPTSLQKGLFTIGVLYFGDNCTLYHSINLVETARYTMILHPTSQFQILNSINIYLFLLAFQFSLPIFLILHFIAKSNRVKSCFWGYWRIYNCHHEDVANLVCILHSAASH